LAVGIPVTLIGAAQLDAGWGLIFLAIGALFEFVVPLLLIVKGSRSIGKSPGMVATTFRVR
jgi:hypothetical protein